MYTMTEYGKIIQRHQEAYGIITETNQTVVQ